MSNSVQHQEKRIERSKQTQYEARMHRHALRCKTRIKEDKKSQLKVTSKPEVPRTRKDHKWLPLFDKLFRRKV